MRYIIGFFITIGLIIILIVMLVSGGGDKKTAVPKTSKSFFSYTNTSAQVRLTADGPINYDGSHRQVQISASKDEVVYNQIDGYTGHVVKSERHPNNQAAFSNFLHALYHSGFTLGDTNPALQDERGYCPQGNRYVYELIQNGKSLERFWSTSCDKPKTYLGHASTTIELFQAQVPNYNHRDDNNSSTNNYYFF